MQKFLLIAKESFSFHRKDFKSSILCAETSALYSGIFYLCVCTYIEKKTFLDIISVFESKK